MPKVMRFRKRDVLPAVTIKAQATTSSISSKNRLGECLGDAQHAADPDQRRKLLTSVARGEPTVWL